MTGAWSKRRKKFNRKYDALAHIKWLLIKYTREYIATCLGLRLDHAILYGTNPPADAPKLKMPPVPDIILRLSGITREEWDCTPEQLRLFK